MKIRLVLLLLVFCNNLHAQQTVTFDLNTGQFNEKLSYIETITIEGIPYLKGAQIDIIELKVTSVNHKFDKDIEKEEIKLGQLEVQIGTKEKLLKDSIPTGDQADEYASLVKKGEKLLADKDSEGIKDQIASNNKEIEKLKIAAANIYEAEIESFLRDKAALIETINKLKTKAQTKIEHHRLIWKRENKEEKFTLTLSSPLTMEEEYDFEFNLYTGDTPSFPTEEIASKITDKISKELESKSSFPKEEAYDHIRNLLDSTSRVYFKDKQTYDADKGFHDHSGEFKNKEMLIAEFNLLAAWQRDKNKSQLEFDSLPSKMLDSLYTLTNGSKLREDIDSQSKILGLCVNFDESKFKELNSIVVGHSIDSASAKRIWDLFQSSHKFIAGALIDYQSGIDVKVKIIEKLLEEEIKNLYKKEFVVKHSVSKITIATDLDATRIGTVYGIGGICLGDEIWELSQFAALNFRFGAFDNRLKGCEAYKSVWSRFSVFFGIGTTSDLEYKGQKLSNTRLGFKPIFGFGVEPIRHVNISAGVIAFVQDPLSSGQSYSLTKFRPIFSIAFDFNAVNYLINKNK